MKRKIETITSKPTTITSATGKKPPLKSELISQLKLLENEYDDLVKANKNNLETIKMLEGKIGNIEKLQEPTTGIFKVSQTFSSDIQICCNVFMLQHAKKN